MSAVITSLKQQTYSNKQTEPTKKRQVMNERTEKTVFKIDCESEKARANISEAQ